MSYDSFEDVKYDDVIKTLLRLEKLGMIKRAGIDYTGSQLWVITDKAAQFLEKELTELLELMKLLCDEV